MLLDPPVIALIMVSLGVSGMLFLAMIFAIRILHSWNINSGSELQIRLERQTWLISTILAYVFISELIALLLFIYNAEAMSSLFTGAMCATGVLNINGFGWPTLFLKIAAFFLGAIWLILNHIDRKGRDYPLIRIKYALLLLIAPVIWTETLLQLLFFINMNPDVITSCCGSLFSADASGVAAEVSGISPQVAMKLLYGSGLVVMASGIFYAVKQRGGLLFAFSGLAAFVIALIAIVSFIALYIYQHPHHHCPFCILKSEFDFRGYLLYIPLFLATAMALGSGIVSQFRKIPSISPTIVRETPVMTWIALAGYLVFYGIATWSVLASHLILGGY